jgi:hypothetical protein
LFIITTVRKETGTAFASTGAAEPVSRTVSQKPKPISGSGKAISRFLILESLSFNFLEDLMKRNLRFTFFTLLIVSLFAIVSFGQETTGSLQGTVKDQNGAVLPNATVTASNEQRTYTETTNGSGDYHFAALLPGVYAVEAKATGFGSLRREGVTVELGKSIGVNFDMKPAAAGAEVTIVADDEPLVDTSSSKTSTNITERKIELLTKGLRFSSVIETAPGVRNEPKGNGFQIDGATGSENVWIVDGLEVTRTFGGSLGQTKNVPLEFVKEVQVKSAGYEAEFGGALGGVINVTTKSGGNTLRGYVGTEFESSDFRANNRLSRRYNGAGLATLPVRYIPEYYRNPKGKDDFTTIAPRFSLFGPVWKDKAWFAIGMAPEYTTTRRTIYDTAPFTPTTIEPEIFDTRDLEIRTRNDYMFGRIDAAPLKNLSAYVSFINSPTKTTGAFPAGLITQGSFWWPRDPMTGAVNPNFLDPVFSKRGGFVPSNAVVTQATYSPLSNLLVSFRWGRNYLNDKGGNYATNLGEQSVAIVNTCNPATFPDCPPYTTGAPHSVRFGTGGTSFDITTRKYMSIDGTWVQRLFGQQHTFKGGFQRTQIANNVSSAGTSPLGNVAVYFDSVDPATQMRGTYGYYTVTLQGTIGQAASRNDALFFQDGWQIHRRITLNLGVRSENETVPTYGFGPLPPQIKFGWGDKLAPRIGGAWDVRGDGRLKVYGSYSVFFDTMKYNMPRGSFGGEVQQIWRRGLETPEVLNFSLANQPGPLFQFEDQRTVSTEPYVLGNRIFPGIDPNLKPTREHEYTFGADYAWKRNLVFSGRFTRKILDVTIDDVGIPTENFENYCICNPGFGSSVESLPMFGYPPTNKAVREYTGLEFRVDKRFSNNWYVNATYLWSRLYGNYSGLASSDESGRGDPNVNRFFDVPWINYTSSGKLNDGLLATDRPNTFKIFAGYQFNYNFLGKRWESYFGASQFIYQGTPLSSNVQIQLLGRREDNMGCGSCSHGVAMLINGRGDLGRTDWLKQTDGTMTTRVYLGERAVLKFGVNVFNLLNSATETDRSTALIRSSSPSIANEYNAPARTLRYGTNQMLLSQSFNLMLQQLPNYQTQFAADLANFRNPFYNLPVSFQDPRQFRFNVGVQF